MRFWLRPFLRAFLLRCPPCGARWPRRGIADLVFKCEACGFRLDRGETDFFLGSYTIALFAVLLLASALAVPAVLWPDLPPWVIYVVGITAIVVFAFWFRPIARLLWLAVDLKFRPVRQRDFGDGDQPPRRDD